MPQSRSAVALFLCALLLMNMSLPVAASAQTQPLAAGCPVIVKNGNFEAEGANWTQSGAGFALITDFNPRAGAYSADLGGVNNADHSIRQTLTLPGGKPLRLSFWWEQSTQETAPGTSADYMTVSLLKVDGSLMEELGRLGADPDQPTWEKVTYDLSAYAGQTVQLQFLAHNDGTNPTRFFVDDVGIPACRAYLPLLRSNK